jgi:hypothetical protein
MLSNAIAAGVLAAAYIAVLILQINPALRLDAPGVWPLIGAVLLVYGIHLAVAFYAATVLRQLLATEPLSPGWLSHQLLGWFCTAAASAAAMLMWLNRRGFGAALAPEDLQAMAVAASIMSVCAVAFLALAIARESLGRRGWLARSAFIAAILLSVALPVAVRGRGANLPLGARRLETAPVFSADSALRRVFLIGMDGASLDLISPAAADGRLPNFARLIESGATLHLATLRPTQPGPIWTAVATGKLPWHNGVRSAATYTAVTGGAPLDLLPDFCLAHALVSFGLLTETMQTAAALRAQPLWTILGRAGLASTIVRWPLTWPAQPLRGTLVTDQYHRASEFTLALDEPGLTYPTELASVLRTASGPAPVEGTPRPGESGEEGSAAPLALDRYYASIAERLGHDQNTRLSALRFQGLDVVSHYFLRFAVPRVFGDVSPDERQRYGRVIEQYYRYLDEEIGRVLDRLAPGDLLVVVSPFGMEPLSPPKRLLEYALGNAALSGTHERAPDGFLLAYGIAVRAGRLPRGSVVDVTPTILYYLGLPIGRDMDGYARADLFTPAFSGERPIAFIPTYER